MTAASASGPSVLAPLAARYAHWLGLPAALVNDTADEDPAAVLAMQLVLRIERSEPPARSELLAAAATAAVALCLDPRSAPGGEWHDPVAAWAAGRIRKVARRARGAHWHAVQELPGLTCGDQPVAAVGGAAVGGAPVPGATCMGAQARALVPGPVAELPRSVSRLQVGGTDLEPDAPGPPPPGVPVLWLNPAAPMTVGKAAAQVGHATMILAALLEATGEHAALADWSAGGYPVAVRTPTQRQWAALHPGDDPLRAWRRRRVVAVRDAGFTEVPPGTVTVLAAQGS